MKNLFLILLAIFAVSFTSCQEEEMPEPTPEGTILGRWVPEGFEDNIRYEFTADKRFDIYGIDGDFPTLEEFQEENPDLRGLDWEYDGEVVVVDLNFGNYSRLVPDFTCDNEVLNWVNEDGSEHSTSYREGHDISTCN